MNKEEKSRLLHHKSYMDSFANRYRSFVNKKAKANRKSQQNHESIALAETMIYIEKTLQEDNTEVARHQIINCTKILSILSYSLKCSIYYCQFDSIERKNIESKKELRGNIRKIRSVHFL